MDYKEKYEQALKRAKAVLELAANEEEAKGYVSTIFPELKESEDERIRKEILRYIKNIESQTIPKAKYDSWLAWLEKQGEQKQSVIIPKFRVGEEIKTDNEESLTITKIDDKGYWSGDLFICDFDDEVRWDLVEQKPAWSEEDDSHIYSITEKLKGKFEKSIVITKFSLEEDLSWLKSIKNRVLPKQEWSEEDEATFTVIGSLILDNFSAEDASKTLTWLHSLRHHPQWKPSDEHLTEGLEEAANEWNSKANFSPFYMEMKDHKPIGVKQTITSHSDSFKAGVEWVISKLKAF